MSFSQQSLITLLIAAWLIMRINRQASLQPKHQTWKIPNPAVLDLAQLYFTLYIVPDKAYISWLSAVPNRAYLDSELSWTELILTQNYPEQTLSWLRTGLNRAYFDLELSWSTYSIFYVSILPNIFLFFVFLHQKFQSAQLDSWV